MSKRICSVEGCNEPALCRGWCSLCYQRWRRNGDPTSVLVVRKRQNRKTCSVVDCDEYCSARGFCAKHYQAWRRNGDPLVRRRNPAGEGGLDSAGYKKISVPGHPLADASGRAREHRVVAWDAGLFDDPEMEVHHKNGDKLDNRPENLQPMTKAEHTALHMTKGER